MSERHGRAAALWAVIGTITVLVSGCGIVGARSPGAPVVDSMTVLSPRFRSMGELPTEYSCRGEKVNPPLRWSGVPAGAKSLALVVDAVDPHTGGYVHWIVFDIDPRATELAEDSVPAGARQALNTSDDKRYSPPCVAENNYRFTVYALRNPVGLRDGAPLARTLERIADETVARGRLTASHIE
ncbi:YbhB/YbcL family Raf kinase inhibitor-like protein [Rhizohabitans arisaemae]|uniref:YbhB/YbcL family Raf kinase inhibitor-like protein n=1 Tax=Rhizohabitans arisaemae TaxID=2720610 RepID=UPI0024B26D0F|nr:YbhB/YbcL family Raf kinase inhibitor-like protein [Rhizohabitans arisaemae]